MSGQSTLLGKLASASSQDTAAAKLKVFLSYSRNDLSVADQLYSALLACGFEPKIDRHGISGGEDWKKRLGGLILEADTVVFLLSPSALDSEMCSWEVLETERSGKRLIPILTSPLQNAVVPDRLKQLNYIYFYPEPNVPGSGFGQGLLQLVEALNTDLLWIREHTRLGQRAVEWDQAGRPQTRLLSGQDIGDAKAWLARRPPKAPPASALHLEFLKASEAAEAERTNAELQRLNEIAAAQSAREDALRAAEAAQLQERAAIANAAKAQSARAKLQRISYVGLFFVGIILAGIGWQTYDQKLALDAQRKAAAVERAITAESISQTSRTLLEAGDTERALQSATEALRLSKVLASTSANKTDWQREVAVGYLRVGDVLRAMGRVREALEAYRDAQSLQEKILGTEHPDLAQTLTGIGALFLQQGRYLEAEPLQARALHQTKINWPHSPLRG